MNEKDRKFVLKLAESNEQFKKDMKNSFTALTKEVEFAIVSIDNKLSEVEKRPSILPILKQSLMKSDSILREIDYDTKIDVEIDGMPIKDELINEMKQIVLNYISLLRKNDVKNLHIVVTKI